MVEFGISNWSAGLREGVKSMTCGIEIYETKRGVEIVIARIEPARGLVWLATAEIRHFL